MQTNTQIRRYGCHQQRTWSKLGKPRSKRRRDQFPGAKIPNRELRGGDCEQNGPEIKDR